MLLFCIDQHWRLRFVEQKSLSVSKHLVFISNNIFFPHYSQFFFCFHSHSNHLIALSPLQKLRMPSGDLKEDRLITSAQSTPSGTPCVTPSVTPSVTPCVSPYASPSVSRRWATCSWRFSLFNQIVNVKWNRTGFIFPAGSILEAVYCTNIAGIEHRAWFQLSPAPFLTTPEPNSPIPNTDMGGNEGGGGSERWNFFGSRSVVQKSPTDPGSDTSPGETFISLPTHFSIGHVFCCTWTVISTIHLIKNNDLSNYPQSNSFQAPPIWTLCLTFALIVTLYTFVPGLVGETSVAGSNPRCSFTDDLIVFMIPAGFSLQSYFGMQKSSTMDGTNNAGSFKVDDPASFMPPKIEITGIEAKRAPPPPRPHKLKPRDMNVLTPSGFWCLQKFHFSPTSFLFFFFFSFSPGLLIYCRLPLSPPSPYFTPSAPPPNSTSLPP